jgi:DNA-directed RNA polymerase subunit beta
MSKRKGMVSFARIPKVAEMPSLIEMQRNSYVDFLQMDVKPEDRKFQGLQAAFLDVFPIMNSDETLGLEFVKYVLGEPRYNEVESIVKDVTYTVPLKAILRLIQKDPAGKVKEIAEQEVFLADLPLMTRNATFIFNGAERVIVSQLHRSPGVIFEEDEEKKISSYGKKLYFARIIPYRGAWLEFEFDLNNALYVRIDKKRKIAITTLLKALGVETNEEIINIFYETKQLSINDVSTGMYLAKNVVDTKTGEMISEAGVVLTAELLGSFKASNINKVSVIDWDPAINDVTVINTILKDSVKSKKEAIYDIYRKLRAQEFVTPDQASIYLENLLFKNIRKYDLTKVGRYKINRKLNPTFEKLAKKKDFKFQVPSDRKRTLTIEDIIATIKYVVDLNNGVGGEIDDIDHLGNRRVRSVGELLENQIRVGLAHMARFIREKMNMQDKEQITPRTLVNSAPLVGIIRKFFGTSQLSQFMDQVNPLAELTHKRRLSALGPGGLNRKRAGFEVRDVHYTHYGRICPVETPEGPNIGLITSLSCYSRVNEYGLIESPYRKVKNGKVTDEINYLTADQEDAFIVAQANSKVDDKNNLASDLVACRHFDNFPLVDPSKVDYMDISPLQVVSPSTALIPFLEHDDANRALMGSNMQRQAVPLMLTEKPVVGTGIEEKVAKDSGATVVAEHAGEVISVTADSVSVWVTEPKPNIEVYKLRKYTRSNQDTCINQQPIVSVGQKLAKGECIADSSSTESGQLALGKNLLVAFMPWQGYNFEDAILINQKLVREDALTSIHILEFEVESRDLKIGVEEITRDIPNVGEEGLQNLDEDGIVRIGAEVQPGDILVGKVTPKGEQQTTPEERLLKVIFGKKAEDVQDASLRVPPGVSGKILDVQILNRKDKTGKKDDNKLIRAVDSECNKALELLKKEKQERLAVIKKESSKKEIEENIEKINAYYKYREQELKTEYARKKENIKLGDELPITVNKIVKVYIAAKRKISVGDKVAGRHGNKGVIAKIVPPEDMPYLPNGEPVDVVLSPLAVPSRMNIGQIMESILGWAGVNLGVQMVTPVFDGATEDDIINQIKAAKNNLVERGMKREYLPDDYCRVTLYNGQTGEAFSEKVTIGYMYILKLAHLVEDKIHARSTGPYSLITRQPLGGKAQFGGQRLGEMEVWAIEGYGASHVLQEFLTVKSDDVAGRTKMYEAILRGDIISQHGIPESFKVLVKELQSLGLNVELLKEKDN